ncbi:MAG: glycosyltransferase [Lentimicrobium sp.]|nr:glycosyltransferase [Lentimicrobium sp.]MDD2527305.1 glycosyltransferase [Lentimicrobiaceae bacterium]MDY0025408.1 glycosyltransferase [Lentimicrobium sp.]HAH56860.1 glycosyltransferase [Bacteroidales bacterium]
MKSVIVSVTNDLSTDQRVDKVCHTLTDMGFRVLLVGRWLPGCLPVNERPYDTHRMKLIFRRGPFFYAEYNFRLLWFLLFHQCKLLVANDLDTLLANFIAHKLKKIPLIYDSHEFYTETPELVNRPGVQHIWQRIEGFIFPKLGDIITVNDSIARLYEKKYGKPVHVVRNIPRSRVSKLKTSRQELGLPNDQWIVILQGAGLNIQRGAEEAIEAMAYLQNTLLLIIGSGDVIQTLKIRAAQPEIAGKVMFRDKMPYAQLMAYTSNADLGLTLDKDTNLNYRFSLPNKLFDYIHARIPVLASNLPEIARIIKIYNIGRITDNHDPKKLALIMEEMLHIETDRNKWKEGLNRAARELTWENEEKKLHKIYGQYA